jgi:hypothetical protein
LTADEKKKKKTFGLVHWRNPQKFVFLVGEEDKISAAANIAATYVKEFDKTIHVSYPMGGKRRMRANQFLHQLVPALIRQ